MTRSVLVTGAGRGLGYELCQIYLSRGWRVFPVVRRATSVAGFRGAPADRCHPIVADVRSDGAIPLVSDAVATRTARLDLLVNNAGIPGESLHLATVPTEEIRQLLDVHCLGVVRCTQAVLPHLMASSVARVINVTSQWGSLSRNVGGVLGVGGASYSYRIAKAAQNMLTVCMSQELGGKGVVVCAFHPGQFRSALNPDARTAPAAAARRMAQWVDGLHYADNGKWYDADAEVVEW